MGCGDAEVTVHGSGPAYSCIKNLCLSQETGAEFQRIDSRLRIHADGLLT